MNWNDLHLTAEVRYPESDITYGYQAVREAYLRGHRDALESAANAVSVDLWATFGRTPRRSVEGFQQWLRERAYRVEVN